MPKKNRDNPFRDLIEQFTGELTAAIAAHIELQVSESLKKLQPKVATGKRAAPAKVDGRRGGRICPVPGCGKPGAGPRNRWFCRDHSKKLSVTEQRSILERNKRLEAEGKLPTVVPAGSIKRLPPKQKRARRALDMSCRVEGCPNRSRGPRAGFICDHHRGILTPEEQKAARTLWNERVKGGVAAPAIAEKTVAPVAPIVRKAETPIAQA
jgi:hypothetical protein